MRISSMRSSSVMTPMHAAEPDGISLLATASRESSGLRETKDMWHLRVRVGVGVGVRVRVRVRVRVGVGVRVGVRETKDMWHLVRAFGRRVSGLGLRAHIRANVRG